jgi:hypothetical protein
MAEYEERFGDPHPALVRDPEGRERVLRKVGVLS